MKLDIPIEIPNASLVSNDRLDRIEEMIMFMLTHPTCRVVDIEWIAEREGVCKDYLWEGGKQRYLLPRFGKSAYPDGKARWPINEYLAWAERPVEERKAEYKEHLRNQVRCKVDRMRKQG